LLFSEGEPRVTKDVGVRKAAIEKSEARRIARNFDDDRINLVKAPGSKFQRTQTERCGSVAAASEAAG